MEKSEGSRTNEPAQEKLQSPQESEDGKVDSDDLHPNRKLQKNTEPTHNVEENNFKPPIESGVTDCDSQHQHLIEMKRKLKKIIGDYHNKQNQQATENSEEILTPQSQDSITTAEHVSNVGSKESSDGIATNKHLETNGAMQEKSDLQRQSSILRSTEGIQQTCKISEENLKIGDQDIIKMQETATQYKVLEIPTKYGVAQYDSQEQELIEREQKTRKLLADYFSKQNQVTEEMLFVPVQDSIPKAEHDSIDAAHQEFNRIDKNEHLTLQQRKNLQRKLSLVSSKKGLQPPCEVSEEIVKVKAEQDIIAQKEIETKHKLSETSTEARAAQYDARDQELIQWERKLETKLADSFKKQNQITMQPRTNSLEKKLITPIQNSIPTAELDSNGAARKELDKIDKKERIATNAIMQQRRNLPRKPLKSSTKNGLRQPCEVSEKSGIVKEEPEIIKQQKSETQDNNTKTLAETDTQNQELMKRENDQRIILNRHFGCAVRYLSADYFNKQNQVTIPQSKHSSKEIFTGVSENPIPTAECALNEGAQQERDTKAKKERLETNTALQQSDEQPRKLTKLSSEKETLQQLFKVVEETVEVTEQDIVTQDKNFIPANHTKTLAETNTQNLELVQQENDLVILIKEYFEGRRKLADYFNNATNCPPDTEEDKDFKMCPQNNDDSSDHPEDTESQKPKQTITYRELQEIRDRWAREHGDAHPETEEDKNLENCPQNNDNSSDHSEDTESQKPKQTITYRELQEIRDRWRREHEDASFGEVFSRPLELQEVEGGQKTSSSVSKRSYRFHSRTLQTPRLSTILEENIPLVSFEDVCPEVAVEISESEYQRFQRNVDTRTAYYSSGIYGSIERFIDRYIPIERRACCSNLIVGCLFCCCVFVVSIIIAVFIGIYIL